MTAYAAVWIVYRTRGQITRLIGVLIGMGFFEAVYGLIQWGGDRRTIFGYVKRAYTDVATGTFINRNHYAAYLAMTLCLAVAVAVDSVDRSERRSSRRENTWDKAILTGFLLVLGLSAMSAAGSRAAPAAFLIAVGGVGFVFQRDKVPRRFWPAFAALALVAAAFMAWLGVEPLNPRYADVGRELRVADARPHVYLACLKIWADAPLLGTGLGSFADVFPLHRPPSILAFYDHAHSDYLETLAESGALGFALLYGGAYLSLRKTVNELRQRGSRFSRSRALGALAAVIAFGLHGAVDFNLAVPANLVTAFTLLGLARTCACRHLREARR
jgi:O-antigen ligase